MDTRVKWHSRNMMGKEGPSFTESFCLEGRHAPHILRTSPAPLLIIFYSVLKKLFFNPKLKWLKYIMTRKLTSWGTKRSDGLRSMELTWTLQNHDLIYVYVLSRKRSTHNWIWIGWSEMQVFESCIIIEI